MKISQVIDTLNQWAPPAYQESYDNSRLIVGDPNTELTGVLISLDCIETVVEEAIRKGCNLIVSHHPIVFKGLKSFTGKDYVERTVIKAIKHDIALFSIHTNLDNIPSGVNRKIADTIGLTDCKILAPKNQTLIKLTTYIPSDDTDAVLEAVHAAGAGQIGNYEHCSFSVEGTGSYRATEEATPHLGTVGEKHQEKENRVEVILPSYRQNKVIQALKKAHPYEEVAYDLIALQNTNHEVGAGMIGYLVKPMPTLDFLQHLKDQFNLSVIKHTTIHTDTIQKVALCGGAGSFLLNTAKASGSDIFITGDFKYHEFFDAENSIIIADIGHYESEVFTKELIYDHLTEKIPNIAVNFSEENTNPVNYF
ncbi:Nif3-like dinuclear metal center hexameric protein [Reichenbachiella agariperforans]|uniref:Nif3-like dinuclear metal center hexameric protein n=1 Tax=Reichenbachiella agariperforans TaxID=156994 RepID=UPI001C09D4A3|nr:Nif3-like dinuclear metal center hexameric protein [Reichenbachiella agariperforans]MBU2913631.1 Nif3-like dinuclear metal center hexameric protein [Reichenbachiella agariperforans]